MTTLVFRFIVLCQIYCLCTFNHSFSQTKIITKGGGASDGINQLQLQTNQSLIAGTFQESISGVDQLMTQTKGNSDIFIHWIDKQSNTTQTIYLGNEYNDEIDQMILDQDNNLYILARFRGKLQINNDIIYSTNESYYLAKYNAQAQLLWINWLEAKGMVRLNDMKLGLDEENIYITGYYNDQLKWQQHKLFHQGTANACIIKIDKKGHVKWMQDADFCVDLRGKSIVELPNHTLWFLGEFRDSLIIQQDSFFFNSVHTDIILAQLDSNGQWLSSKKWGGVLPKHPQKMVLAKDQQSLWIAGEFVGILNADQLQLATAFKYYDVFWIQLDLDGQALQAGQSSSNANSYVTSLATASNAIYLGGYFQDSISGKDTILHAQGASDAFWYQIGTKSAEITYATSFGGVKNDILRKIVLDEDQLHLVGDFQGQINIANQKIEAVGPYDGFYITQNIPKNFSSNIPLSPFSFLDIDINYLANKQGFTIKTDNISNLHWKLYNLKSKLLASGNKTTIFWKNLPKGVYSLHIETSKGIAVKKVEYR